MVQFDFDSNQASEVWLTDLLTRNGYLKTGSVGKVTQHKAELGAGGSAALYSLTLQYTPTSTGVCPSHILMKVAKSGAVKAFEDRTRRMAAWLLLPQSHRYASLSKEPFFYESVRNSSSTLPLITCYGSVVDEKNYNTCLLLEDLSGNHTQPPWPIPPNDKHSENTIKALAEIHAHWWESNKFGSPEFPLVSASDVDDIVEIYGEAYSQFKHNLGDRLSKERRSIFEATLSHLPKLLKDRMSSSNNLTLSHGDAHHWNTLLPASGEQVVIFDWQTWHIDTGAHDLAYLMGALWYPEHRRRQEEVQLRRYLDTINAFGIQFSWKELVADYRLSVVRHLFAPVIFSSFITPAVWWPQLDRVFCTFDDWGCIEMCN